MSIEQARANATTRAAIDESLLGKSGDPSVAQALGTPSTAEAPKTRKRAAPAVASRATSAPTTTTGRVARQRTAAPVEAPVNEDLLVSSTPTGTSMRTSHELPPLDLPTFEDITGTPPALHPSQQTAREVAAATREERAAAIQAQQQAEILAAQREQIAQFEAEGFAADPVEPPRVRQRPAPVETPVLEPAPELEATVPPVRRRQPVEEVPAYVEAAPVHQRPSAPTQRPTGRRSLVNRELVSRLQTLNELDADSVERQLFDLRDMINKLESMTGVAREMQLLTMAIALAPILEK